MEALPTDEKMSLTIREVKSKQTLDYSTEKLKREEPSSKCMKTYYRGHQYTNFQSGHELATYLQN